VSVAQTQRPSALVSASGCVLRAENLSIQTMSAERLERLRVQLQVEGISEAQINDALPIVARDSAE
jgi:hypothetical protein